MGYASKLAQSWSNPESIWNSLGAVGGTSAWDRGGNPLGEFSSITGSVREASQKAGSGPEPYAPAGPPRYGTFSRGAWNIAQNIDTLNPENIMNRIDNYREGVLAGKFMNTLRMKDLF